MKIIPYFIHLCLMIVHRMVQPHQLTQRTTILMVIRQHLYKQNWKCHLVRHMWLHRTIQFENIRTVTRGYRKCIKRYHKASSAEFETLISQL